MTRAALEDLNALGLSELFVRLGEGGLIERLITLAHDEDAGAGDITSIAWPPATKTMRVALRGRSPGIVAGLAALPMLIDSFAPSVHRQTRVDDGSVISSGETLATLEGPAQEVLRLERTLLNLVSRLSGVATLTRRFVDAAGEGRPGVHVLDTRKTTPGLRRLEKYAVRCGGGHLHRLDLGDAVLLKDNHLAQVEPEHLAESVADASARARADRPLRFVEVEVDSLDQFATLLTLAPGTINIVLLDNMAPPMLRDAVRMRDEAGSSISLEASGGVTLETIGAIAATGIDRISVGAMTHQAVSLDLGLDAI